MAGDAGGFVGYPMVEEAQATGVVAAVYAGLLEQMPFVPSLFKSLALCPGYLLLAYERAEPPDAAGQRVRVDRSTAGLLGAGRRGAACRRRRPGRARGVRRPAEQVAAADRRAAAGTGRRAGPAVRAGERPRAPPGGAAQPRPLPWDAPAPRLYGEIRAALDTPIVNSIWRTLAGRGLLEPAWAGLRPQVAASRPAADDLQVSASAAARRLPWRVAATPAALQQAGLGDARPGMASVLDAYLTTLPRVLVLVASSADAG